MKQASILMIIATILSVIFGLVSATISSSSRPLLNIPGLNLEDVVEKDLSLPTIPGLITSSSSSSTPNGTVYVLAMERPKQYSDELTLHGLWPQSGRGPVPGGEPFNAQKLAPIRDEMDKYWYSYKEHSSKANESFWNHEWTSHGQIWARDNKSTQLAYFQKTLTLLGDIGFYRCDKKEFCDCRCNLDANYKVIGECTQKGTTPPV